MESEALTLTYYDRSKYNGNTRPVWLRYHNVCCQVVITMCWLGKCLNVSRNISRLTPAWNSNTCDDPLSYTGWDTDKMEKAVNGWTVM